MITQLCKDAKTDPSTVANRLGILVHAGAELFKCSPKLRRESEGSSEELPSADEEKYYSICGEVAATVIYLMQNIKVEGSIFLQLAFAGYLGRIVKVNHWLYRL